MIMEILKRKLKVEREENQNTMTVSLINGVRLSMRFANKETPENDLVINFTTGETEKLRGILNGK